MLLPAPLPPTSPTRSPSSIFRLMSRRRPELGSRCRRLAAQHQVERRALERVLLVGVVDKPKRDVVQLDQRLCRRQSQPLPAPRRSESKDHLVFLRLEDDIADSQVAAAIAAAVEQQADPGPLPRVQNVVEHLDEVIRRIETKPPLLSRIELPRSEKGSAWQNTTPARPPRSNARSRDKTCSAVATINPRPRRERSQNAQSQPAEKAARTTACAPSGHKSRNKAASEKTNVTSAIKHPRPAERPAWADRFCGSAPRC